MMRRWLWWIGFGLLVPLLLAACGNADDTPAPPAPTPLTTAEVVAPAGGLNLDTGPDLDLNLNTNRGTQLPGCSDPDSEDCPAPVQMQLDGTASHAGITIRYPSRYFTALAGDENPQGIPLQFETNENFAYENEVVFQVYYEPSMEQALSSLDEPISAPWTAQQVGEGTIAVQKVETQDPPVSTVIGAFPVAEGQVVVLKLIVDGEYGWDLFSRVYEAMLNTLTVTQEAPAE